MHSLTLVLLGTVVALGAEKTGKQPSAGPVEVSGMLLKLVEQVDVPAREAGVLSAVGVTEGQMVEEGTLLAQIDDAEGRIALDRVKIELAVARRNSEKDIGVRFAKKSAEVAKAELRRSLESVKKYAKSVSDSELDRQRLLVEKSTLEVEQAEHEFAVAAFARQIKENEYQAAEEKLTRHKILSSIKGMVVQIHRHRGEWVKPGEAVARVARLDRLRAEGFLRAEHLRPEVAGKQVKLTVNLPDRGATEFVGKIVFLDPEIDPVNSQVRVWVEVVNRDLRLRPGMRATMTLDRP